jgi:Caudovirus prohead serine protease
VRQMANGVRDAFSIGFVIRDAEESYDKAADSFHYRVTAAELVEVSSCVIPMFADARHERVAASRRLMAQTEPDPTDPEDDPEAEPDEGDETMAPTDTATNGELDDAARLAAHTAAVTQPARLRPPARYASFGAYARAKFDAGATFDAGYERIIQAAWTDQTTADITGIVPEQWMTDLVDLMGAVTPTVQAFSQRPLPAAGMVVNEPRVDQGPDVGVQAVEKTEIASRKVLIAPVPFNVATYAGGQDISIQALLRSDPSYFDELMRLYAKEMAVQIETDAAAAVLAGATNATPITGATLNEAIVDASAAVFTRTFQLPTVAVLGVNLWIGMGKAEGTDGRPLFPGVSPANPVGSFSVTTPGGQVRGLTYYVSPSMNPDSGVIGITDAFRTRLGPIGTLSADVPSKLGRDVAVYRFATMGVTDTRGLQELNYTATGTTATTGGRRSNG